MAVFRVERNSNYTTMSNYHLRDNNLSLKAKGLLSVFLSLPDSWHYSVRGLVAICKEGRDCIVATLHELEDTGYLERHQQRQDNGKMGVIEYVIFEKPQSPCTENPDTVYPNTEKPDTENPPRIITNKTNTEQINELKEKVTHHKYGTYQNVLLTDVAGPILFYDVNEDGEEISMTAQEIYAVRLAVESRTVTLTEKGRKFAAFSID